MKKIIGWPLAWIFFWLGDLISKPLHYLDWWWLYPVYNRVMISSADIQDWSGVNGPWEKKNG